MEGPQEDGGDALFGIGLRDATTLEELSTIFCGVTLMHTPTCDALMYGAISLILRSEEKVCSVGILGLGSLEEVALHRTGMVKAQLLSRHISENATAPLL